MAWPALNVRRPRTSEGADGPHPGGHAPGWLRATGTWGWTPGYAPRHTGASRLADSAGRKRYSSRPAKARPSTRQPLANRCSIRTACPADAPPLLRAHDAGKLPRPGHPSTVPRPSRGRGRRQCVVPVAVKGVGCDRQGVKFGGRGGGAEGVVAGVQLGRGGRCGDRLKHDLRLALMMR